MWSGRPLSESCPARIFFRIDIRLTSFAEGLHTCTFGFVSFSVVGPGESEARLEGEGEDELEVLRDFFGGLRVTPGFDGDSQP